ncbi:DUF1638 domain-containing protein [Desulfurivibrio sp. D14AmB]|uniref:DUF1638 domain-containing protein n=1 Tax=Desulfurivibrio sp. D14AmB TaxID=3374370 RepID=UPI00376EFFC3
MKAGPRPKTVVACQVLVPELQAVLGSRADLEIISLPAALHTDMDRLNRELDDQLAICRQNQENELCVVYGRACSPGIEGVAESHRAACLEADNCLDALLGPRKTEAEAEGAFVLTPGWIRAWPSIMEAMGWDGVHKIGSDTISHLFPERIIYLAGELIDDHHALVRIFSELPPPTGPDL